MQRLADMWVCSGVKHFVVLGCHCACSLCWGTTALTAVTAPRMQHDKYLEEVASCNVFIVKGNVVTTPPTSGSILPGVTRKSIIQLAKDKGYEVREEPVVSGGRKGRQG